MTTEVFGHRVDRAITDRATFREMMGKPGRGAKDKVIDHVDDLASRFIAASPFAALATRRADGGVDVTPRGDPAGFALVLDEKTIVLPERPGNRRGDALDNILQDPRVGLLFMIPGHNDTVRVSGKATIVQDAELAKRMAVRQRTPEFIILIQVERLLSHCPKAFIRSSLWQPEGWPDTSDVPSLAELVIAHSKLGDPIEDIQALIDDDKENRLY